MKLLTLLGALLFCLIGNAMDLFKIQKRKEIKTEIHYARLAEHHQLRP